MRRTFVVGSFMALLLAALPISNAQQDDDDGDNAAQGYQVEDEAEGPQQTVQVLEDDEEPNVPTKPENPSDPSAASQSSRSLRHSTLAATAVSSSVKAQNSAEPQYPISEEQKALANDAKTADIAAKSAKKAASVARQVANHSINMAGQAKDALKDAHDAVHRARVDSSGLSRKQKRSLKAAEAKLKEATKKAHYGEVKNAKYSTATVEKKELQEMDRKMEKAKQNKAKRGDDLEAMREEIQQLRRELKKKEGDTSEEDEALKELEDQIEKMEKEDKDDKETKKSHDEMKAEIERLREEIQSMEDAEDDGENKKDKKYDVKMKPLEEEEEAEGNVEGDVIPVQEKSIDIDTAMPYGDLEPFGREDTAQELTENSIRESDAMVDQLERAEVSEEKRAVFRALTRLRGAAITSFDGVARSQTGNIDEYNKVNKWRNTHPLHHLADEESDISKWAFPENAD